MKSSGGFRDVRERKTEQRNRLQRESRNPRLYITYNPTEKHFFS